MATADTIYRAPLAASSANPVTTAYVWRKNSDSTAAAVLYIPSTSAKSVKFKVSALGRVTSGGSYTWVPNIQYGTSTTAASNTTVAAASSRTIATTTAVWCIEATFLWDVTSQILKGQFWAINGSTQVLDVPAITTVVTSVDLSIAGNGFVCSGLIGTTNASNIGYLDEFSLEAS